MNKIFGSATRTVLILMVVGLLIFTSMGIVSGNDFKDALLMVLSFYFGKSQAKETPIISPNADV